LVIRNGNESLSGCHPDRAGIGLRQGTSWSNPGRTLVQFKGDGTIRSSGGTVSLGTYSTLSWYIVKVRYERTSPTTVKISYWINGTYKGDENLSAINEEDQLTNLQLDAQEGTVWFDNIIVGTEQLAIEQTNIQVPSGYYIAQNYPNPFNAETSISFELPKSTFVNLSIYNVTGQLVESLVNEYRNAGYHNVIWNASGVGSGLYFYRITAGEYSETKKCAIIK
jgi:hypothetical protein